MHIQLYQLMLIISSRKGLVKGNNANIFLPRQIFNPCYYRAHQQYGGYNMYIQRIPEEKTRYHLSMLGG